MSTTHDEIIATAMLLGAEFVQESFATSPRPDGKWRCLGTTRWYLTKQAAALGFMRRERGIEVDFNGDLYNTKEK